MKLLTCLLCFCLLSCAGPKDPNYLGYVKVLPEGTYRIVNNDIPGYDAHQYPNLTTVKVKH